MTKSQTERVGPPAFDWHAFQTPLPEIDEETGEPVERKGDPPDECETCGQSHDVLIHQVDDSGNPTLEARQAAERGDSSL